LVFGMLVFITAKCTKETVIITAKKPNLFKKNPKIYNLYEKMAKIPSDNNIHLFYTHHHT